MSHENGEVRFNDGSIKHFEYNGTSDICIPKLYDTYDEMIDNWKKYNSKENNCEHFEEPIEIYTRYRGGFYWNGVACRKCMMIIKGDEPFEDDIAYTDGIPEWAEKSYD